MFFNQPERNQIPDSLKTHDFSVTVCGAGGMGEPRTKKERVRKTTHTQKAQGSIEMRRIVNQWTLVD